ncbi:MAG TPA: PRC-barrel domain-containing protein [Gammaproteobacteria bacterium]|nr:PRC-barrel domain-containing protein [Gammaproteobacteria bacterium]
MKGKSLYSQSGQELGKIDELARDKTTGKTVAIVSTGGFLGVGGEKVAMPVENIQIEGDRAVTASVTSKEELKQMATAGTEQYEKLDEGQSQRG